MWSAARSSTWAWMSSRCSGGATNKMRSRGIVSGRRGSVSCSSVRGPVRPSRNCFGFAARERGHSLVPAPPERMSAYRRGRTVPSAGAGRRSSLAEVVEAHRGPHLVERPAGLRPGTLAPRGDDLLDELRVALVARAPLADGCEEALQGLVQALLDLDVADLPGAVASLEVLDLRGVVVEGVVIDEDGVALDPPGIRGADAAGVGVHALDLQPHGLRLVGEVDGVFEALAHRSEEHTSEL